MSYITKKIKVADLTGLALDWAVAFCEGWTLTSDGISMLVKKGDKLEQLGFHTNTQARYSYGYGPSTDWRAAGPIIEREAPWVRQYATASPAIAHLLPPDKKWFANAAQRHDGGDFSCHYGETFLIAAMRCYVASRLGREIDVPEVLL